MTFVRVSLLRLFAILFLCVVHKLFILGDKLFILPTKLSVFFDKLLNLNLFLLQFLVHSLRLLFFNL